MNPSTEWAARPPLLRLGLLSTAGAVIALLCAEIVGVLGSGSRITLGAHAMTAVSLGVVTGYCWFTNDVHRSTTRPSVRLHRARNGLAGGLIASFAIEFAGSFSGERVGIPSWFNLPLAILVAMLAIAFAWVAIVYVGQEQAFFSSLAEGDSGSGAATAPVSIHPPLEGTRDLHGLVSTVAVTITLVVYAAGSTPYVLPFAGLVLIPSVATWAYASLRLSRLDRRPLPKPSPDWPPHPFRVARVVTIGVLALVPIGVLGWVLLSVDGWGADGMSLTVMARGADLVLVVAVTMGLAAAVGYPFFTIAEALRTPMKEASDGGDIDGAVPDLEPLPEWTLEAVSPRRAPQPNLL